MYRLAVNSDGLRVLELLNIILRQLRSVHLDHQLVELAGKGEWWLVVSVVDAGQRVGTDVEALVPLEDHGQCTGHGYGLHRLAVHLERAGAGTTQTTHIIEGERAHPQAVILEVEFNRVPARREGRSFPLNAFDQVESGSRGRPACS